MMGYDRETGQSLVEAVKEYARDHYNDGGWDYIVECYDDTDLSTIIGSRVRTAAGAIRKVATETGVHIRNEVRRDVQGA